MLLDDFRSRVAQAPGATAVQDGGRRLTYLQLARHACGLAARLARRGVGPDEVVAVYADRSAEIVVAELAVLLAGAAYLPLDPAHPAARTSELLALSGARAVVSAGPLAARLEPFRNDVLTVDLTGKVPASWRRRPGRTTPRWPT
jgi:non-ribosomal peptide synthetase component F